MSAAPCKIQEKTISSEVPVAEVITSWMSREEILRETSNLQEAPYSQPIRKQETLGWSGETEGREEWVVSEKQQFDVRTSALAESSWLPF